MYGSYCPTAEFEIRGKYLEKNIFGDFGFISDGRVFYPDQLGKELEKLFPCIHILSCWRQ